MPWPAHLAQTQRMRPAEHATLIAAPPGIEASDRCHLPVRLGGCASAPIGVRFRAALTVAAHHSGQKAPHRARLPPAEPHARLESRDARIRCGRAIFSSSYCHRVGQPETEASARSPYRRSRPCSDSGGRLERACVKQPCVWLGSHLTLAPET